MNKSFSEMMSIDVRPFCKKRDGMLYLNWAMCKKLLHDNGAEKVYFEPLVNDNGSSLFMTDLPFKDKNGVENRCYEVAVKVVIDDLEFIHREPLMNGSNPVKDNSLSQQRLGNAQKRAFVKGVAIHTGLGFGLWLDEEDRMDEINDRADRVLKRLFNKTSSLIGKRGMSAEDIAKEIGYEGREDYIKSLKMTVQTLVDVEELLDKLGRDDDRG